MAYDEDSLLPLSGIQHFAFCPRQWALIHIERQWSENLRTVQGRHLHERVHSSIATEARGEVVIARSLPLVSYRLGLYGVADVVEFQLASSSEPGIVLPGREGRWYPRPVEYKRGRAKPDDRDEVQLCAQAMCLEEMLKIQVAAGNLFYGKTQHRVSVLFGPALRKRVESLARQMHETFEKGVTPPAPTDVECKLCSLMDICIPDITRKKRSIEKYIRACLSASVENSGRRQG
ncbi:MAG TPA: CRISPR-associated protein Cas4 [Firmicutes bacterium]|nr:CRISPR-associated protein Cas4 [Bacillota bacterium]